MMGFAFKWERRPQTFANHRKYEPLFHFVLFPLLVLNLAWAGWRAWSEPALDAAFALVVALSLLVVFFALRVFPLRVQDRVIRLEMRLRMREILPPDLARRAEEELDEAQLAALRFAPDEELEEHVRWVLETGARDRMAIKRRIRRWRPDYLRC